MHLAGAPVVAAVLALVAVLEPVDHRLHRAVRDAEHERGDDPVHARLEDQHQHGLARRTSWSPIGEVCIDAIVELDVGEVEPGRRERLDDGGHRAAHDHDLEVGERARSAGALGRLAAAAAEQAVDEAQRERHLDEQRHLGLERLDLEHGDQRVLVASAIAVP